MASAQPPAPETPGFDRVRVEEWLGVNVAAVTGPFRWRRLEGGHSNLTYELTDTRGARIVVRRPPMGDLLPKAHDMKREFTVLAGLGSAGLAVPRVHGICQDPTVTGAVFSVMDLVEGRALFSAAEVEGWLSPSARARVGPDYIDTLARLHRIDPAEVGLDRLGRPDGYVDRQLRAWYGSWEASIGAADYDDPRIHQLHRQLADDVPDQGPARVVHGDYGLHNILVTESGRLAAVLDWEIATLGDPLADLAYALNGWVEPNDVKAMAVDPPTSVPGFGSRAELIDRYRAATGADLSRLDWYRAFNYFKVACIIHGVYARYRAGMKSTEGVDLDALALRIGWATDLAVERLG